MIIRRFSAVTLISCLKGLCQKDYDRHGDSRKNPKLLIADEPTTALESTTQAQLFRLLASFNQLKGMSILLISHELETVARNTQTLSVIYCGPVGGSWRYGHLFLKQPLHPYTDALIKSVPEFQPELSSKQPLYALHGSIPTLQHLTHRLSFRSTLSKCPQRDV